MIEYLCIIKTNDMYWSKLSMADRANYIQMGVKNGITSIDDIRDVYNKYAEGGYKGDENNPIELPEYEVYPYKVRLDTYRPFNKRNFIGHSQMFMTSPDPSVRGGMINTRMEDNGYNIVTSNCSDDTDCILTNLFNKPNDTFLFTTPGDVRDFFIDNGAVEDYSEGRRLIKKRYPYTYQSHTMNVTKDQYERGIDKLLEIRKRRKHK